MPIPSTGALSLNTIQTEFGGSPPTSINEYYAGGGLVPSGTTGTNGAVPSSGQISFSQFYGTANQLAGFASYHWFTHSTETCGKYFKPGPSITDSSGNVYVMGGTGFINGANINTRLALVKYDNAGNVVWWKVRSDPDNPTAANQAFFPYQYGDLAFLTNGNIIIATPQAVTGLNTMYWIFDTSGNALYGWSVQNEDRPREISITVDSSNNLYSFTLVRTSGTCYDWFGITKRSVSSIISWIQAGPVIVDYTCYGVPIYGWPAAPSASYSKGVGSKSNFGDAMQGSGQTFLLDSSGAMVVAYERASTDSANVVKIDSAGNYQWSTGISGACSTITVAGIASDSSNNLFVAGVRGINNGSYIFKLNSSGTLQWARTLSNVTYVSIAIDSSGNVYAAGHAQSGSPPYVVVAKYDTNGTLQWQRRLNQVVRGATCTNNIYIKAISIDNTRNLVNIVVDMTSRSACTQIGTDPCYGAPIYGFTTYGPYTTTIQFPTSGSKTGTTSTLSPTPAFGSLAFNWSASSYTDASYAISAGSTGESPYNYTDTITNPKPNTLSYTSPFTAGDRSSGFTSSAGKVVI